MCFPILYLNCKNILHAHNTPSYTYTFGFEVACSWLLLGVRRDDIEGQRRRYLTFSKVPPHPHTSLHSGLTWTLIDNLCQAVHSPSQTPISSCQLLLPHFLYFLKYCIKAFQKKSIRHPRKQPL